MNESYAYRTAMVAVLKDEDLDYDNTLDVLGILIDAYRLAKYKEKVKDETV